MRKLLIAGVCVAALASSAHAEPQTWGEFFVTAAKKCGQIDGLLAGAGTPDYAVKAEFMAMMEARIPPASYYEVQLVWQSAYDRAFEEFYSLKK